MWRVAQANPGRFFLCLFDCPPVAQHTTNHPERADSNRRGAMNQYWAVRWVIRNLQELINLLLFGIAIDNRNVEVLQADFLCLCLFISSSVLGRSAKVKYRLHALCLQFLERLELGLPAGAKLFVDESKVIN